MNPARFTRPHRILVAVILALPLLAAFASPAAAYRYWNAPISALATDPARWNPNGVPFAGRDIEVGQIGTYLITFNGSVAATNYLTAGQGNPFVDFTSAHTSYALLVSSSTSTVLTCEQGTLNMQWMELGGGGGNSTLTLTSKSIGGAWADFHSQAITHSVRNGDNIGYSGPTAWAAVQVFIAGTLVGVEPTVGNAPAELRFAATGTPSAPAVLLDLPMAAEVDVRLYDITGRVAASLHSGPMAAGRHRFELRNSGERLASGAYFARATVRGSGETIQRTVKTMMLR